MNVHPLVFSRIMDTLPVSGWQVLQENVSLQVRLSGVRSTVDADGLADAVRQALQEQGAIAPRVEVQYVASIPKTSAGKAPLVRAHPQQAASPEENTDIS
ncbi:hypothetical protein KSF_112090 [Reticulibacter mediterranei]|uniref:AMP-binding enzyme C-terminal domain-containing protein n=1 Tax=Reticulibacter mediterranei TaxID=2778369 RepID=A0A8J3J412_9CHLR|nr:hypothetical protein [Reticulibacter mediterranei]GHP01162.1 hypothetical protein KSF_112090 [Reticulibacter mediterranei]